MNPSPPKKSHELVEYLEKRYADQIEKITVCLLDLPVPFGVAPLAGISEGKTTDLSALTRCATIRFPSPPRGFYDLASQKPSDGE